MSCFSAFRTASWSHGAGPRLVTAYFATAAHNTLSQPSESSSNEDAGACKKCQTPHAPTRVCHAARNVVLLEVVDKQGLPHAMMFTTKRITNRAHAETELLLDYGQPYWHFYMAETARLQAVAVSPAGHCVCP